MNEEKEECSSQNTDKSVTMQMVAEQAGVSRSAVSYALRNNPNIREAARKGIQGIATEMGYRRNAYVSTLMAQVHGKRISSDQPAIAWVFEPEIAYKTIYGDFNQQALVGAKERVNQLGYFIETFFLDDSNMSIQRLGHFLKSRGIQDVVFAPVVSEYEDIAAFPFSEFACSCLGYSVIKPKLHRVSIEYAQGMRLMRNQIEERGYRNLGLIMSHPYDERTDYLYRGVFMGLQSSGQRERTPPYLIPDRDIFDDEKVQAWLRSYLSDAIICGVDSERIRHLVQTMEMSYNPDLFVINMNKGSSDSGIRKLDTQIGCTAVDLVVNQIHRSEQGIPETPSTTLIPYQWVDAAGVEAVGSLNGGLMWWGFEIFKKWRLKGDILIECLEMAFSDRPISY